MDLDTTANIVSLAQAGFGFLDYVKQVAGTDVIAGLFKWDSTLVEGSEQIKLKIEYDGDDGAKWWYYVQPLEDYTFVRFPTINSGLFEQLGYAEGASNPEAIYWRWTAYPPPGVIVGGNSKFNNAKVDLVVIGYRPKALIKYFSNQK